MLFDLHFSDRLSESTQMQLKESFRHLAAKAPILRAAWLREEPTEIINKCIAGYGKSSIADPDIFGASARAMG